MRVGVAMLRLYRAFQATRQIAGSAVELGSEGFEHAVEHAAAEAGQTPAEFAFTAITLHMAHRGAALPASLVAPTAANDDARQASRATSTRDDPLTTVADPAEVRSRVATARQHADHISEDVAERWIAEGITLDEVIMRLHEMANEPVEASKIIAQYRATRGKRASA